MKRILRDTCSSMSALAFCAALSATTAIADEADYVVRAGDAIELFVAGTADLKGRFVVQADGSLSLPMLGRINAGQRTLKDLQDRVKAGYASGPYRSRTLDGREITSVLQPSDVVVSVVDYQPIYVSGDVSKPGEQTFRPGKTARQAIAVSGGPDVVRYRASHPGVEVADAKGQYDDLSIEITKRKLAIWRLRRELGDPSPIDLIALKSGALEPAAVDRMVELERKQFDSRVLDFAKQREALELAAKEVDEQLRIMTDQLEKEERGRLADVEELRKVQEMFAKGSLPSPRVTDARRAVLLSATRKLQIDSQIAQYRRQKGDIASNLLRLDGLRTIEIQDKLTSEGAALAAAEAKISSTINKLKYLGMLRAGLSSPDADMFKVTVHRGNEGLTVGQDFALSPGDVVEVTLRSALTAHRIPDQPIEKQSSSASPEARDPPAPKS